MREPQSVERAIVRLSRFFYKLIAHLGGLWAQLNHMKLSYLRCYLFVLMILCCLLNLSAQIVLHDATNVTQTQVTLSAEFPENSTEHGFQYKYGTLPKIDAFSQLALSPTSDPVQINNKSSYAWSARSIKRWIESNPNVPANKESKISIDVTLYDSSNLTYEWSVDSEEGIGILNLQIDGVTMQSISGFHDFESVTVPLTAGHHTISWSYSKDRSSNIGLDIGMLRNISITNTTPNDWIDSNTGEIYALYPSLKYLYRAYSYTSNDDKRECSAIKEFETLGLSFSNLEVSPITQTTATLNYTPNFGDANADFYYVYGPKQPRHECSQLEQCLLNQSTTLINTQFSSGWKVDRYNCVYNSNSMNIETIEIDVILTAESTISFEWLCYGWQGNNLGSKTSSMRFYIDDESKAYISNASKKSYDERESVSIIVSPGIHKLKFETNLAGGTPSWPCWGGIWNLNIPNVSEFSAISTKVPSDGSPLLLDNLNPKSIYGYYVESTPNYESQLPTNWINGTSQLVEFETLGITFKDITIDNITQTSAKYTCNINNGDAIILSTGLEFKEQSGKNWSNISFDDKSSSLSYKLSRLKPNTLYEIRVYADIENLGMVYSDISEFSTLPIIAHKPEIIKISQHQATLLGNITSGDANIYQRGMQFKTILSSSWDNIEDTGNDSIFTLIRRNLEMGVTYAARTYVQPAGDDVIYSDTLVFSTLDSYFLNCNSDAHTQTSVTLEASLADTDDDASIDYGFEYYITSDGFSENIPSEAIDIPAEPNNNKINAKLTRLTPSMGICWRTYASVNGEKFYCTGSKNSKWDFVSTDKATITVKNKKITQTSISLELDATQEGDAIVSQIEYALANSVQDTQDYSICGNTLTLNNLIPDHQYNIRFRGLVNGQYCPLLKDISWDYSWFEYNTLPVNVDVSFSGITQTKAKMEISFDSGDAEISDISYRLNYGDIIPYTEEQNLTNLIPGISYTITVFAKVNGVESSWSENSSNDAFKFTTKSVSTNMSISEIYQTAAEISWTSNVGDATFICSGLEYSNENIKSESESEEQTITGLIPNRSYSCRSFVETVEGGRIYSTWQSFTTKAISTTTLPVSNISNRSATMNGTIECDDMSSAEFGFQWKQMEGWLTDPAFTKGHKLDDGSISVALVNGMLEPNTDYQYRTAVRYHNEIYTSNDWKTFRTESEFIYYPPTVYTVFRTDRENNALILCGYYIAGSETITSQGYEYWQVNQQSYGAYAPQNTVIITTDESMQHTFLSGELASGNYAVRAFVKTETGNVLYGATLGFNVSENGYSSIDTIDSDDVIVFTEGSTLKIINGINLSCYIYNLKGLLIAQKCNMSEYEEFHLDKNAIYIVKLSNGKVMKLLF